MKGHPLHGTNPLADKLSKKCDWGESSSPGPWKLLVRKPGTKIWHLHDRYSRQTQALEAEQEQKARGMETKASRL